MKSLVSLLPLKDPLALAIDPVNLCNFRCKFCPTCTELGRTGRPNGLMKIENFKKIIDDIYNSKTKLKALKLWKDGEPLLHKQLPEMIAYAKKKEHCFADNSL